MLTIEGHADKSYDRELKELCDFIVKMGDSVLDLLQLAAAALESPGSAAVDEAKQRDREINQLDLNIEDHATMIMTRRQPFMEELRFIISAIKMATELERMGDMAKSTVKRSAKLTKTIPENTLKDLLSMLALVRSMLIESIAIFKNFDTAQAQKILENDDKVDAIYKSLFKNLQDDMMKNPGDAATFTHVIFAAKNLERIGDHAASLAKIIYYVNSGEKVTKNGI